MLYYKLPESPRAPGFYSLAMKITTKLRLPSNHKALCSKFRYQKTKEKYISCDEDLAARRDECARQHFPARKITRQMRLTSNIKAFA